MRSDYELISRLGRGAYGVVLKAKHKESNTVVALKQIYLKNELKCQLNTFREISCLKNCDHVNIVSLRDVHFTSTTAVLVLEFVDSDLRLVIDDIRRPQNFQLAKFYFVQALCGLAYLHHLGIMHRDVKPENMLVHSGNNLLKIADFGLACLYFPNDPKRSYEHQVMTRYYRAPELLFGSTHYNPKVDIWAMGCILAEFLNGTPLFAGSNDIEQIVKVFHILGTPNDTNWPGWERLPDSQKVVFDSVDQVASWHTVATTECLAVLTKILRFNHRERPTALECLQMDFFAHGVPPAVDDYHPSTAEQAREERLQRRALRGRRHSGEGDKSEWDIVFNDDMDVEPYLL